MLTEGQKQSAKKWLDTHRKYLREAAKKYYWTFRPTRIVASRKWQITNHERYLWAAAKRRAKKNDLPFTIEVSDIHIPSHCPVLGIPLFPGKGTGTKENSPSLDRVDNTKGYEKGNVCVISHRANRLKSNLTLEQIQLLLAYMGKGRPE